MKYAADFRSIARNALRGKWAIAVIAGLIASLLGAVASNGPELKLNISDNGANVAFEFAGQQIYTSVVGCCLHSASIISGRKSKRQAVNNKGKASLRRRLLLLC